MQDILSQSDSDISNDNALLDDSMLDKDWLPEDFLSGNESGDQLLSESFVNEVIIDYQEVRSNCDSLKHGNSVTPSVDVTETIPGTEPSVVDGGKDPLATKATTDCNHNIVDHEEEVQNTDNLEASDPSESPSKKRAKRGRSDPQQWERNVNRRLRMQGNKYEGLKKDENGAYKKLQRSERSLGPRGCSKRCQKSCKSRHCYNFTDSDRKEIFDAFWKDMDWNQKQMYVASLVDKGDVKEQKKECESRRNASFVYHLRNDQGKQQVCRNMFLSTLGIGEQSVYEWLKKD